ncbi:MAG: right-handed parallel beta-helix repeat-containing protein [Phycisphaerales bacterium]|jgi:predicted outer membrane repeat protein
MPRPVLCFSALLVLFATHAHAQTPVGGTIDVDTTWALADSPFSVTETVRVTGDATLTIQAGVEVAFEPGTFLSIDSGVLVARGTASSRIEFLRGRGVMLMPGADSAVLDPDTGAYVSGTVLEHVVLQYIDAEFGAALEISFTEPLLRHVWIREVTGMGVEIVASEDVDVRLEDLSISTTSESGLTINGGRSATLERVRVGNVAIADRQGAGMHLAINDRRDPTPAEPDIVLIDCEVTDVSARWGLVTGGGWLETRNLVIEDCDGDGLAASTRRFDLSGCRYEANTRHISIRSGAGTINSGVFRRGGGVGVAGAEVTGCRFEDNNGTALSGATVVRDNLFLNNRSTGDGGALALFGFVDIDDNRFEGNSAVRGGAIFANGSIVSGGNTFVRNSASFGGAAWLDQGVRRSILGEPGRPDVYLDNTASEAGGALYVVADEVDFAANEFEGNQAVFGGAIAVDPLGSALYLNRPEGGVGNRLVANHALFGSDIYLFRPDPAFPTADTDARCVDWGTSDPAAVAERIYDAADAPGLPEVLYLPLGPFVDCVPDFDGNGALTIFDFLLFANLFEDGDPRADLDGDGELTLFDFLSFQTAFDAGC